MTRVVLVLAVLLTSCAKPDGPQRDAPFRVFYPDAGPRGLGLTLGERMQAKPAADCQGADGRDARWANTGARLAKGDLPPGLVIEDSAIAGVPTTAGSWQVTLTFTGVTCSAKPMPDQTVDVAITVSGAKR